MKDVPLGVGGQTMMTTLAIARKKHFELGDITIATCQFHRWKATGCKVRVDGTLAAQHGALPLLLGTVHSFECLIAQHLKNFCHFWSPWKERTFRAFEISEINNTHVALLAVPPELSFPVERRGL